MEAQLSRQNTGLQPDRVTLPSVQYVTKAFKGTILDDATFAHTLDHHLRTLNALVRHVACLSSNVPDHSADRTSIAWVRFLLCLRLLLRLESWPAVKEDTKDSLALRRKDVSIQDFIMRLEFVRRPPRDDNQN